MPVLETLIADVTNKFLAAKNLDAAFMLKAATELGKKLAGLEMDVSEKKAIVAMALKKAVASVPVPAALDGVVASVMGGAIDAAVGVVHFSSVAHSLLRYLPSCFQVAAAPVLDSMDKALIAEAVASQSPQTVVSSQESLAVRVPDDAVAPLSDIPDTNAREKVPSPEASPLASLVPSPPLA